MKEASSPPVPGDDAVTRFVEYFTVHIQNPHTRRAYFRNAVAFLRWCEGQGFRDLKAIKPMTVAAYIEQLQHSHAKPSVKQHLATIRMLFDWLVTGQVIDVNPAHAVRGPKHVVTKGKTPVLTADETSASSTASPRLASSGSTPQGERCRRAQPDRPARPGAHRRHGLHLRPRRRRGRHEGRGLLPSQMTSRIR